jgi:peptidoglycan hydrolase-like protein with peptidoglycan-binding domain
MAYSLLWLPDVLRDDGLKVATVDGWEERGHGDVGRTLGVLCHHTAGPKHGNMPSLGVLIKGRPKLPGPLAQLGLGRDGTYYVVAAGRCHHAGDGEWNGVKSGNTHFIGIEAENTGGPNDSPWPSVQVDAYQRGVAAILKHSQRGAADCAGHKEYALPRGRKPDPTLDMDLFRAAVHTLITGTAPAATLIPATEPSTNGRASRPTLRRGDRHELVRFIQKRVRVEVDGDFGSVTEAALRVFQRNHQLVPDGIAGPKTWAMFDKVAELTPGLAPATPPEA